MSHTAKRSVSRSTEVVVLWVLLAVGCIPLIGRFVTGEWNPSELGLGAAIALFASHGLFRAFCTRSRS